MTRLFTQAFVVTAGAIIGASGLAGHAGMIHAERHARDCNQVTATIPAGTAPRGIAMNLHTDRVYVADIGGNTMTVIDGKTNKVTATIGVGSGPDAVAVDARTNMIYALNDFAGTVSVIDGKTDKVIATIPVGGNPLAATVNPRTDTIYVTNFASGSVSVISGRTNTVTATIHHVSGASQIALLRRTMTLYVADDLTDSLWVINARTNTVTKMISVGTGADRADGIAADPKTRTIYLPQQNGNVVVTINGLTNAITGTFPAGRSLQAVAITVSRRLRAIYVTDSGQFGEPGTVSVISQRSMKIEAAIKVGVGPEGIAVDDITRTGYAINEDDSTVSVLALCRA